MYPIDFPSENTNQRSKSQTEIVETDLELVIQMFPNPAKNSVTIVSNDEYPIVNVKFSNLAGVNILELKNNSQQIKIPLTKLENGIYFVEIRNAIGEYFTEKLVVER